MKLHVLMYEARRHIRGLRQVLDEIYEVREQHNGVEPPKLNDLIEAIEQIASHEALAKGEGR